MLESPLDSVEPYIMFRNAFLGNTCIQGKLPPNGANNCTGMKAHQPQLYDSLAKTLSPEEQTVIGGVVEQANLNEAAAAAAAIALQHQANGN